VPSTVFANLVASVPAYYLNRTWSWGKSGRSHVFKEVVPFWTMTAIGITMSIGTASVARHLSNVYDLHHFGRTVVVEGANTGAFALLWVVKFLVFNRLFNVDPVAHADAELFIEAVVEVEGAEP
jgi:putative flippase GtrA